MKNSGMTLIEVLVVVAVIGILATALGASYVGWQGSYLIESQAKELYGDFMDSRIKAMQRKRAHFAIITADEYSIFEDTNGNGVYDDGTDEDMIRFTNPRPMRFESQWTGTITVSTRGMLSPNATIFFDIGDSSPDYDCIDITATRANLGQYDTGAADCEIK
jgi:prepilin-type N-terminal cleavage/methylation domain-containing protein